MACRRDLVQGVADGLPPGFVAAIRPTAVTA